MLDRYQPGRQMKSHCACHQQFGEDAQGTVFLKTGELPNANRQHDQYKQEPQRQGVRQDESAGQDSGDKNNGDKNQRIFTV
jgi:hypothetical protein